MGGHRATPVAADPSLRGVRFHLLVAHDLESIQRGLTRSVGLGAVALSEIKDTSFRAVGRLHPKGGLTPIENTFAKVKIPYEKLPSSFEVKRVEFSQ